MSDFSMKIKRQTEILCFAMDTEESRRKTVEDLSVYFDVEPLTINRDLKDLRFDGIDISSRKKHGVSYFRGLDEKKTCQYILSYSALNFPAPAVEKATSLLVKKFGPDALRLFINLRQCIEQGLCAKIIYEKTAGEAVERIIGPVSLFVNDGQWRLLAGEDGKYKQYLLIKMMQADQTSIRGEARSADAGDLLKNAWGSWLGSDIYNVRIRFDAERASLLKPKLWIDNQQIQEQPDGSIIFSADVNSLREISSWILGWGKGCEVIEPPELKELVIRLAKETLENYAVR